MTQSKDSDVLVVGAGPVGLFLACELALRGVTVRMLERDADARSAWKDSSLGRRGITVPAIQAFYRRGILDKILTADFGARMTKLEKTDRFQFGGHFAGRMMDVNKVKADLWSPYHLPGPSFSPGVTNWGHMEAMLAERAESLGVNILRGKPVTQLLESGDHVQVATANDEMFTSKWLVGCDGGQSSIRKAANMTFTGTDPENTGYLVKGIFEGLDQLQYGFQYTRNGMYIVTGPEDVYAFDRDVSFDRSRPITAEHFQKVIRRITGKPIVVKEVKMASSLTDRAKLAEQYRKGRIFLAGDAAHIHSPLGANGLGLGIVDAMNLGWKLAAEVQGTAPSGLLDTYEQERKPIAETVLEWCRAQTAIMRPDPNSHAMADFMHKLLDTEGGTTAVLERTWGFSQKYDLGGTHQLVGMSAPDFEFEDGSRLGDKMYDGRFVVIDFQNEEKFKALEPAVQVCGGPAKETFGIKTMIVRPDGIVAWLTMQDVDIEELQKHLAKWLVMPSPGTKN